MAILSRRNFLKAGVAAGAAGLGVAGFKYAPGMLSKRNRDDRPNIIMITSDTTRYDRMGFNGYGRNTTPNLDKYAEDGVAFHKNYAQAPVTVPSTSSLLTSQYPATLGTSVSTNKLPESYPTLASLLKQDGYKTFGSTSVYFLDEVGGFAQGFDHFTAPTKFYPEFSEIFGKVRPGADTVSEFIRLIAENNLKGGQPPTSPNFYWMHLYDAHTPYAAPDVFTFKFQKEYDEIPGDRNIVGLLGAARDEDPQSRVANGLISEKRAKEVSDMYDGQISYVDAQAERFLNFLIRQKLFDKSRDLVLFTADHGELMGEHGYSTGHIGCYEEVTHVPLMFSGAGLPKGKSIDALTANLDVVPTVMGVLDSIVGNSSDSRGFEGKNLVPLIKGNNHGNRDHIFTELPEFQGYTIHDGNLTLSNRFYNDHEVSDPIDGFSPSGVSIDYDPSNLRNVINFRWTDNLEKLDKDNLTLRFRINGFKFFTGDYQHGLATREYPYSGPSFDLDIWWLWGKDNWNEKASWDKLIWGVQVFEKENPENVLFDSRDCGKLEFRLNPSPDFNGLYDSLDESGGETNHYDDPAYASVQKSLEMSLLSQASLFDNFRDKLTMDEVSKERREELEALGYI